ncbi:MAG: acyl-CoA thioesterase [Succinivibrio sp.]
MYKKPRFLFSQKSTFPISFHDTDAMGVVWHGNYIKFFELAREALFDELGYGYAHMKRDGIALPITECNCRYRNMLSVTDKALTVDAMLVEYDCRIVIAYEVYAKDGDVLCAYGSTHQVAMDVNTKEVIFKTPEPLEKAVMAKLERIKND